MFNKNAIKKEVNTVTNRSLSVCVHWESYFSNKARVTLILHTANIENDMNMTVGK